MPHTTEAYRKVIDLVEAKNIPYKAVRGGQVFRFDDGIKLTVLGPYDPLLRGTRSDLNSNSVIARLDHKGVCFLLMGDAELETEHQVLEHGIEPCEVLKVAHHGSAYASSKKFLEAAQPEWAAISVGRKNRYKHPAPATLRRLEQSGAKILRTDQLGRIMFESNGKRVRVAVSVNPPDVELPEGVVHTPLPRETNVPVATRTQELPARPVAPHAEARAALAEKTGAGHAHGRDALAAKVAPSADGRVSINEATRDQLMAVPGIGPAKAEAILSYRQSTGPFASISEVDAVPGIGPATLEKLSKHLFVP
jgi:competence ComEA-like helix-hairpin-helix protein